MPAASLCVSSRFSNGFRPLPSYQRCVWRFAGPVARGGLLLAAWRRSCRPCSLASSTWRLTFGQWRRLLVASTTSSGCAHSPALPHALMAALNLPASGGKQCLGEPAAASGAGYMTPGPRTSCANSCPRPAAAQRHGPQLRQLQRESMADFGNTVHVDTSRWIMEPVSVFLKCSANAATSGMCPHFRLPPF